MNRFKLCKGNCAQSGTKVKVSAMKRYSVSRLFPITFIFFVLSLILMLINGVGLFRLSHLKELNTQTLFSLQPGQYVSCTINQYVLLEVKTTAGTVSYRGSNWTRGFSESSLKSYDIYTISLDDKAFVDIGFEDSELIAELEAYSQGRGNSISFIGKVMKTDGEEWSEHRTGTAVSEFRADAWVKNICIAQINLEETKTSYKALMLFGVISGIIALLLFFSVGGIQIVYRKPYEESKRYKDLLMGKNYKLEVDLKRKKEYLDELRHKQKKAKLHTIFYLIFSIICTTVLCINISALVNGTAMIYGVIIALILFLGSIYWLWKSFINTDFMLAIRLSDLFMLDTLSIRIEETSIIIEYLNRRLSEEKNDANFNYPSTIL